MNIHVSLKYYRNTTISKKKKLQSVFSKPDICMQNRISSMSAQRMGFREGVIGAVWGLFCETTNQLHP